MDSGENFTHPRYNLRHRRRNYWSPLTNSRRVRLANVNNRASRNAREIIEVRPGNEMPIISILGSEAPSTSGLGFEAPSTSSLGFEAQTTSGQGSEMATTSGQGSEVATTSDQSEEDLLCSLCLDTVECKVSFQLACGHNFHITCISSWLAKKMNCPLCRSEVGKETVSRFLSTIIAMLEHRNYKMIKELAKVNCKTVAYFKKFAAVVNYKLPAILENSRQLKLLLSAYMKI